MSPETVTLITILSIVIIFVFYVIRLFSTIQKKKLDSMKSEKSQVGFVVDTFHDLVSKLKEKESELEVLRKQAEEKASSIEIYNENIFQSVPSGIVSFDKDFKITKINSSAEKILGLTYVETADRQHSEIFHSPIAEFISRNETIEREECSYVTNSGKRIWLGLTISPLKDRAHETIGQLLVFTDLTELKAFQSQFELRERLSSLGEMSAGIAHELRNPMGVISGYTRMLSKKVDESLLPAVESISKEIEGMDRIISDFLSFAKPSDLVISRLNLRELIDGCMQAVEERAENIRIVLHAPERLYMSGDEVLLRQCINNLFQNSIESMPDGGELHITVSTGESLRIVVSDTGHGIPQNIKDKIFLPFYTTKERGTGLGLSIVHKILISHGGNMMVETSDTGTTFTILLPKELLVS